MLIAKLVNVKNVSVIVLSAVLLTLVLFVTTEDGYLGIRNLVFLSVDLLNSLIKLLNNVRNVTKHVKSVLDPKLLNVLDVLKVMNLVVTPELIV